MTNSAYNYSFKIIIHSKFFPVSDWLKHCFKIFSCFWLVKTTHIIHHSQLLLTKFAKNFVIFLKLMTSKVQPIAYYWTIDQENLGMRLYCLTKSKMTEKVYIKFEQRKDFEWIIKAIIEFSFHKIWRLSSADLGGFYPPWPSASVDNTLFDLQTSYPTQPHSIIAN